MGDKSAIEWTDATWNPTTGCDRVSPGCANCYALTLAGRNKAMAIARGELRYSQRPKATDPYMRDGDPRTSGPGFGLMIHESRLDQPLRWARPRRIFVNSMSDLFHEEVPDDFLDDVFAVMAVASQHTFQVLTKRPERMRAYVTSRSVRPEETIGHAGYHLGARVASPAASIELQRLQDETPWPIPNVWLGTSVENDRWTTRVDELRETPAAIRFISAEPLLGGLPSLSLAGIAWLIVGGESAGPEERRLVERNGLGVWTPKPEALRWVRLLRDKAREEGVAFLFKQWGGPTSKSADRRLDDRLWDEYPVRELARV